MKKLLLAISLVPAIALAHWTKTETFHAEGVATLSTILQSNHYVSLQNSKPYNQIYNIEYQLCADKGGCYTEKEQYALFPNQIKNVVKRMHQTIIYPFAGQYKYFATTKINGDDFTSSIDFNDITVRSRYNLG